MLAGLAGGILEGQNKNNGGESQQWRGNTMAGIQKLPRRSAPIFEGPAIVFASGLYALLPKAQITTKIPPLVLCSRASAVTICRARPASQFIAAGRPSCFLLPVQQSRKVLVCETPSR